jgi:enterochelin esterase-like enzyme
LPKSTSQELTAFFLSDAVDGGDELPKGVVASMTPPSPPRDDNCSVQYIESIIPYVEENYRVKADRNYRAIAGLSMGGLVVLGTGLPHLDVFSELYVYSSGYFPENISTWESNMSDVLNDSATTNSLLNVHLYMSAGDTDIALENAQAMMAVFEQKGIKTLWQQSSGGHEWPSWRRYLHQTAQLMFTNTGGCD